MSNRGQPRALDDEKQKSVCSLVAAGASRSQAAILSIAIPSPASPPTAPGEMTCS
jgi:hypothetical protein